MLCVITLRNVDRDGIGVEYVFTERQEGNFVQEEKRRMENK